MKKLICFSVMLVLCLTLVCPALADESDFVPSIGYKDYPEIIGDIVLVDVAGNAIEIVPAECLLIVPISKALAAQQNTRGVIDGEKAEVITDVNRMTAEERTMFVDTYNKLLDGTMTIPYPDGNPNKVIRDLVFAKFLCEEHSVELAKEDVFVKLTFNVGVAADEEVDVMIYNDNQWIPAESIVNNGDGTVTTVLDILGVISFSVPFSGDTPVTGDNSSSATLLWVILMVASAAALVVVIVARRKIVEQ